MMEIDTKECRERLIDEVKKYPVLYDTKHENHRDVDVRDRCWMEISERIGANSEVLKREWKNLRDSLRQVLKKNRKGGKTKAGAPCKKWRFEGRMSFLLPYMTMRSRDDSDPLYASEEKRKLRREQWRASRMALPAGRMGYRQIKSDVKLDETEQSEQEQESWEQHVEQDSLDLFFASVCQSTKRLPKKYQSQLKKQVLDALLRVEEECENEPADNKPDVYKGF
ncbi:uncharacterized protein [Epargyreus clarus]|uniref:uncharacterized protein n=1 Tax=Epargyreus clarus TaxID=520877 RepID=UPI003C2C712F